VAPTEGDQAVLESPTFGPTIALHRNSRPLSYNGYSGTDTLLELVEASGLTAIDTSQIQVPRQYRGWIGATLITATKP
jgi:hypothetical protein